MCVVISFPGGFAEPKQRPVAAHELHCKNHPGSGWHQSLSVCARCSFNPNSRNFVLASDSHDMDALDSIESRQT